MTPFARRTRFSAPPTAFERQLVPVVSTMIASLAPVLPLIATQPLLPPFGLMTLLGWRLLRNDIWPVWAAIPLGAWDDLVSGQPIGSAALGWGLSFLVLDALDRRVMWRDYWQDWGIAAALIAANLTLALLVVRFTGGITSPLVLMPQLLLSILLYPVVARLCTALDRRRFQK